MTDEQLVLAMIRAYKDRGIDMSALLDDYMFTKLPAVSKIRAIQAHAAELHNGINPKFTKLDYKNLGVHGVFDALAGGVAGATIGAGLHALNPMGMTRGKAMLSGALITAAVGAMAGSLKAVSNVGDRKDLRTSLAIAKANPTPENAIGVLSTNHMTAGSHRLRDEILNRVGSAMQDKAKTSLEPYLHEQHNLLVDIHNLQHPN